MEPRRTTGVQYAPMRLRTLPALAMLAAACESTSPGQVEVKSLVLLTRSECPDSPVMRGQLDEALKALGLTTDYHVIDAATVHPTDPRNGYPAPTVLYEGADLFGMPEPEPPFAEPSCRLYTSGVPSSADIQEKLKAARRQ